MSAGLGRQVRGGRGDCLNAGLLIVGDNRHRIARFCLAAAAVSLMSLFAIDAQNLRHLLFYGIDELALDSLRLKGKDGGV